MGHNFIVSNPQIFIMSIIRNYILLEILLESIRLLDSDSCKASNLWVLWDLRFWFILRSRKEPGRGRDSHCQRYMLFHLTQHQNANCLMISSVLWLYTVSQSFWHVPPDYILHFVGADGLKPLSNHFPSGFGSWLVAGKREGSHPLSVSALISATPSRWLRPDSGNDKKCSAGSCKVFMQTSRAACCTFLQTRSVFKSSFKFKMRGFCFLVPWRIMTCIFRDSLCQSAGLLRRWPRSRKGQMVWGEYERFMVWHFWRLAWWRPNGVPHHDFLQRDWQPDSTEDAVVFDGGCLDVTKSMPEAFEAPNYWQDKGGEWARQAA